MVILIQENEETFTGWFILIQESEETFTGWFILIQEMRKLSLDGLS